MTQNKTLKVLAIGTLFLFFSCDKELEDCYETVCSGPDNTNCVEVPSQNSDCFPNPDS